LDVLGDYVGAVSGCASVVQSEAGLDVRWFDFGPILFIENEVEYLLFDEGKQIVVGSVLNDAGARRGKRVAGSSGNYFQVKVKGIV
jgi:hypothetical protein